MRRRGLGRCERIASMGFGSREKECYQGCGRIVEDHSHGDGEIMDIGQIMHGQIFGRLDRPVWIQTSRPCLAIYKAIL